MEIILDERESKLKALLQELSYVSCKSLDIGDVHIQIDGETKLLIERKTNEDMKSSLFDGRYKEQKRRILETGYPIMYILEGESFLFDKKMETSTDKAMQTIELSLGLNNQTRIMRTRNVDETALYLKMCGQFYVNNKTTDGHTSAEDLLCVKKSRCVNSTNMLKIMLCQIPGVSVKIASSISAHFQGESLQFFSRLNNEEKLIEDLSTIMINKRKIGKITAKKIVSYLIMDEPRS